jgi:hypothetical protein
MKTLVPNEKFPMFFDSFSQLFDIDYTNLQIIMENHYKNMLPSRKELALMARDLGITVRRFPVKDNYGYRLIRENRDVVLTPRIHNETLAETIVQFNKKFLSMIAGIQPYMKEIVNAKLLDD